MNLYTLVSAVLAPLNLAVVRRSTLDQLVERGQNSQQQVADSVTLLQPDTAASHMTTDFNRFTELQTRKFAELRQDLLRHEIASKWSLVDNLQRQFYSAPDVRRCPLCDHSDAPQKFVTYNSHCIFGGGVLCRYQCPTCDLIFGAEKMLELTPDELTQDYEWHYQAYQEGDSTAQEIRAFHALNPVRSGRYLNYGAGAWSSSVQILRDEGWQVYAYEPHASASNGGPFAVQGSAELSGMQFDGIYSNNVLEHLRQPVQDLSYMRTLLRPGGAMAHATPCYEYLYEFTRFHLFFFLGRSRSILAKRAGLVTREYIEDGEFMCGVFEPEKS